jgi:hypothetical protein
MRDGALRPAPDCREATRPGVRTMHPCRSAKNQLPLAAKRSFLPDDFYQTISSIAKSGMEYIRDDHYS